MANSPLDDILRQIAAGEIPQSFILAVTEDEESIYCCNIGSPIEALEFLEKMVAGYRAMVLEDILKRMMN